MNRLQEHRAFLSLLSKSCPKQRKILVKSASPKQINAVCEIAHNILRDNVKLSPHKYRQLRRHKKALRYLAKRGIPLTQKKNYILKQQGGFLPILASVLGPLIGGLLGGATG